MRRSFAELYVHLVWATWDRLPLLTQEVERLVYACIRAECSDLKAELMEIGGTEDHVHVLVKIPTTLAIADLVKQIKGSSSHLVTHRMERPDASFKWQGAYGAFTVSRWDVPRIRAYIQNQRSHHADETLDEDLETVWEEMES